MGDLVSYIGERGGVDLLRRPFGEVDSLVLAQLSYLSFKPCSHCAAPCDKTLRGLLHGCYDESFLENTWEPQRNEQLLRAAAGSERFGGVRISGFVNAVSPEEQKQEIMEVHEKVKELTGCSMQLFRPPYGDYNNELILSAQECGYYTIQWSVDASDTE